MESHLVLSRFVHEIRNPLALIGCELQLLATHHPESENWSELANIQEHLLYLKQLLSELSDYANAGRLVLQSVDMNHFLNTVSDAFRPMFDYLGIRFFTDFAPNLPCLQADSLRLRQALTNLLRNAEEAISHDHGTICLRAHMLTEDTDSQTFLHITIQDNGCGISSEQLKKIGSPFTTFKENGTGLGLSIARQIIEGHGGTLQIESTLSSGTVIHLYLPSTGMIQKHGENESAQ